ncbi:MAG: hypothetical protein OER43_02405 [Gammaproteobacteria bacterium]|nr:hypothetical protein [Gammaproteobacteria bacterium]MDH3411760.1 hypothetical protein [Gammaproteobacteria bacterium]
MKFLQIAVIALAAVLSQPVIAQDKGGNMNMEILRQKIKADKKLIVASNMQLTEAEAKKFWPVYESYQEDLAKINQRLGKLIVNYAEAYNKGAVPDATAKKLLTEALAIEGAELRLKRAYVPKLEKVLPKMKVARYIQIENKIRAIVRYELAAEIPLVE